MKNFITIFAISILALSAISALAMERGSKRRKAEVDVQVVLNAQYQDLQRLARDLIACETFEEQLLIVDKRVKSAKKVECPPEMLFDPFVIRLIETAERKRANGERDVVH